MKREEINVVNVGADEFAVKKPGILLSAIFLETKPSGYCDYFESQYFQKLAFESKQIIQFGVSARHDLDIADHSDVPDVVFRFSYDALIKVGITLIARKGYKVRSSAGIM
jgi:hypothetical protein